MIKRFLIILFFFSITLLGCNKNHNHHEFSTSMDFTEFEVVLKYLKSENKAIGQEMLVKINKFKNSSKIGQSRKSYFQSTVGYMILEREDDLAFSIAIFTSEKIHKKMGHAYTMAINELDI